MGRSRHIDEQAFREAVAEGLTVSALAREFLISQGYVRTLANRFGVSPKPANVKAAENYKNRRRKLNELIAFGLPAEKVAERMGVIDREGPNLRRKLLPNTFFNEELRLAGLIELWAARGDRFTAEDLPEWADSGLKNRVLNLFKNMGVIVEDGVKPSLYPSTGGTIKAWVGVDA